MKNTDPRIDAYIAKSADFAQPILRHLRELVHEACPEAQETMKWSAPHFLYRDALLCSMVSFKEHLGFGFWHQGMEKIIGDLAQGEESARGSFGRIASRSDLPDDKTLRRFIAAAMRLIESGAPGRPVVKPKATLAVPEDLAGALKKNKKAASAFEKFPPSHRREYIEWIIEAKRDETRQKRLATTIEWLAEGKSRNWKYESC
jgi:uncharacterized protein YdeI (YjbR/CyaY-like superfamily)